MSAPIQALARDILGRAKGARRYVFAIAGAPGSGKSTLAELHYGLDPAAARARALGNDIPNARLVAARSRSADVTWSGGEVSQGDP